MDECKYEPCRTSTGAPDMPSLCPPLKNWLIKIQISMGEHILVGGSSYWHHKAKL